MAICDILGQGRKDPKSDSNRRYPGVRLACQTIQGLHVHTGRSWAHGEYCGSWVN